MHQPVDSMSPEGISGEWGALTTDGDKPCWKFPDGKRVYVREDGSVRLQVIPISEHIMRQMPRVERSIAEKGVIDYLWPSLGRWLWRRRNGAR